ncbi:hypothetical protein [Thermococcus barossii]|uniref:DUF4013 domain-containing protein n=1 Tax=Thermococcus barossii TaxID=54077 RepID=A0A2Z2MNT3_9EURY|nr:hypothetical protein [Thermococcus barossii]ASJ05514.1 hypothetical protein A3L01_09125 [Thermococcus barossii]
MRAFEALGETLTAISKDRKLWRYPVIASGMAGVLIALSDHVLNRNIWIAILIALPSLLLQLTVVYYPTRAFYYHQKKTPFEESALVMESITGGIKVLLVSIVYGLVVLIVGGLFLLPAILAYYILSGTARYVLAGLLGLPPAILLMGVIAMMIPAYVWTRDFGEGLGVIGVALDNAKEVFVFGALMAAVSVGLWGAAQGLVFIASLVAEGITGALLAGLLDGLITGLSSVISGVAGAAMYRKLRVWVEKERPVRVDPDWLASL